MINWVGESPAAKPHGLFNVWTFFFCLLHGDVYSSVHVHCFRLNFHQTFFVYFFQMLFSVVLWLTPSWTASSTRFCTFGHIWFWRFLCSVFLFFCFFFWLYFHNFKADSLLLDWCLKQRCQTYGPRANTGPLRDILSNDISLNRNIFLFTENKGNDTGH